MSKGQPKPVTTIADIRTQVDVIAMKAVADNSKTGLRALSPVGKGQRLDVCLDEMVSLISTSLGPTDTATLAATATYRANLYKQALQAYENCMDEFLTSIEERPTRQRTKAKIIDDAIVRLRRSGHPLVVILVEMAQHAVPTLNASSNAKKGKQKIGATKAFALQLYEAKTNWKSVSDARKRLWPQVRAEAKRLGWTMSEEEGPETLYAWLLAHKKSTLSAS